MSEQKQFFIEKCDHAGVIVYGTRWLEGGKGCVFGRPLFAGNFTECVDFIAKEFSPLQHVAEIKIDPAEQEALMAALKIPGRLRRLDD
jgi:hypothetical protein